MKVKDVVKEVMNMKKEEKGIRAKESGLTLEFWLYIGLPLGLLVLLALALQPEVIHSLDNRFYAQIEVSMNPLLTIIMLAFTHLGDVITIVLITGLIFLLPRTRKKLAIPLSIGILTSTILNLSLKELFARERPGLTALISESTYSFPSGHSMINMTLYAMLAYFFYKTIASLWLRKGLIVLCLFLTGMIGISRVYLGVHYISDVGAGLLLGLVVAGVVLHFFGRGIGKTPEETRV